MKNRFFKHLFLSVLVFIFCLSVLISAGLYVFLSTNWGAKIAAKYLIALYVPCDVAVLSYQGTIEKGLVLKNVTLSNIPSLGKGMVYIQELQIHIESLRRWKQISFKIIDARLKFPSIDPIIFNGTVKENKIQGVCFAQSIDAKEIVLALGYEDLARNIYGYISHVDFTIQGALKAPRFAGHFFVDKFNYKKTQVSDGFGHLDLIISSLGKVPSMTGSVVLESAIVDTHKINVDLITSKVNFNGDVKEMLLDIHGTSKVEDIVIDMTIKGTLEKPQLLFNSDPPLSEDKILFVLATGKSWSGIADERSSAFGLRKKLTNAFDVGMEVEEMPSQVGRSQTPGYSRTIEGKMNLTEKFSLNVAQKFRPTESTATAGSSQPVKDKDAEFYLQYKERF